MNAGGQSPCDLIHLVPAAVDHVLMHHAWISECAIFRYDWHKCWVLMWYLHLLFSRTQLGCIDYANLGVDKI